MTESRECLRCRLPIVKVDTAWVVIDTGTTADGLSYCPPNPDHLGKLGNHRPKGKAR